MKKIYFNISVCILFPLTVLFIVFLIQCFAWNIVDRSGDLENRYYSYGKIIKTEFTFSGREYYTDKGYVYSHRRVKPKDQPSFDEIKFLKVENKDFEDSFHKIPKLP